MVVKYFDSACGMHYNYKNNRSEITLNYLNRSAYSGEYIHNCYGTASFTINNEFSLKFKIAYTSFFKGFSKVYEINEFEENSEIY